MDARGGRPAHPPRRTPPGGGPVRLPPALARTAARLRPALPPALVRTTVEVASLVAAAPLGVLPGFRRVLVVAPHPDDETIGCGGTLARLADGGAHVEVVVATDGEATIGSPHPPAETARRRRGEAVAACRILGTGDPRFLGLPDGRVADHLDELARGLATVLADVDAEVVFVPWALERHPDHRAVIAALARVSPHPAELWGYEAHTPLHPTHLVDLAPADVDRKRSALAVHATADLAFSLEATLALNRWRSLGTAAGDGHAEAFHATPWDALPRLAALGDRAWARRDHGARPAGRRPRRRLP
ncbi:PIG-L family deacetylase [Nitriliruptoraceae bacterium ZYF776]|nr:PIG-L family deacetylase [Profundirhabdus halotolerans]